LHTLRPVQPLQMQVRCVQGVHAVQWHVMSQTDARVQLQLFVNAQPMVFSTQSSVTPPHAVISRHGPPSPPF